MNAAARTYVECMKIIGWTVIVAALMYLVMIPLQPGRRVLRHPRLVPRWLAGVRGLVDRGVELMRPAQQSRIRDGSELDVRLDWWLREHGQPPTYDALRDLNRHQHPWAAHNRPLPLTPVTPRWLPPLRA